MNRFGRLAAWAVRRPGTVIAVAVVLTLLGAVGATRLDPEAATDSLVDRDSATFDATERFNDRFGDDPVVILVRGQLEDLLLTENLGVLLGLEGCLAGASPPGEAAQRHVRADSRARTRRRRCSGPRPSSTRRRSTSRSSSAASRRRRSSRRASPRRRRPSRRAGTASQKISRPTRRGSPASRSWPSSSSRSSTSRCARGRPARRASTTRKFVSSIVFDTRFAEGVPKAKFSDFFPSPEAAADRGAPAPRPQRGRAQRGDRALSARRSRRTSFASRPARGAPSYVVSGVPVVVEGLTAELESEIFLLLGARPRRDGGDADDRLRAAASPAAAGRRARGDGDRVRGASRSSAAP